MQNDEKKKNVNFDLAPSNSRSKYPHLGRYDKNDEIRVSIDRLTIVGELKIDAFEKAVKRWLELPFIEKCGNGYQVLDYSNCEVDDFGNPHDYVAPEQVAYFEALKFTPDKIRIDFNPNHSMQSEAGQWLLREVIGKIRNKHFSRCDVAFDIYNHPEISLYQVWQFGMTKKFFYGQDGEMETVYFGSRSSNKQIRLYNKKLEQEKRHGKIVNVDAMWRLEMQLRGSEVAEYPEHVKKMLESFYMPDWENEKRLYNRMILYALVHEPKFYGQAPKTTKQRYRKMLKEAKPSNSISIAMAKKFAEDIGMLERTLQEMMQRFHVKDASSRDI